MNKPESNEYKPYFDKYIRLVPEGNILTYLNQNTNYTMDCFLTIPESKQNFRYEESKWTPKEMFMHILDTERVMSYRALVAARGDTKTSLASVDENLYAANVDVSERAMEDLVLEFKLVRQSTEKLLENLTEEQSKAIGDPDANPISARAVACLLIGHSLHHIQVLQERYF
ncbi:MAG: DinB family protein [Saprospiraceae bacterium]|nr:DinB family protein [Saprospiraceae bacterium]MBK9726838.1 DinB family protein [Saprospiraceae bacterium]